VTETCSKVKRPKFFASAVFWFFSVVLDQKFKEKLGSVAGKGSEKEDTESHTGTDHGEDVKLERTDNNLPPETDQLEQTTTKDEFTRIIEEMKVSCWLFVYSPFP